MNLKDIDQLLNDWAEWATGTLPGLSFPSSTMEARAGQGHSESKAIAQVVPYWVHRRMSNLDRAINDLAPFQNAIIEASYMSRLTVRQMAEISGVSERTIYRERRNAQKRILKFISKMT